MMKKGSESDSDVFVIRLSSPPLNILNAATRIQLLQDLEHANRSSASIIVLVGSERAFSVGADINEMNVRIGSSASAKQAVSDAYVAAYKETNLASVVYALDSSPKPIVALILGQCFGGGLELALGCQYRIATQDARFRFPETLLGILPGALGTQLLPRLVPFDVSVRMCTGACDTLLAAQARDVGLVDQVMSVEEEASMASGSNQRLESYLARAVRVLQRHLYRVRGSSSSSGGGSGLDGPHPFRRTSLQRVVSANLADSSRAAYLAMKRLPGLERGGRASQETLQCLLACVQHDRDFVGGARVESDASRALVVSDEAQSLRWAFFAERAATSATVAAPIPVKQLKNGFSSSRIDQKLSAPVLSKQTVVGVVGSGTMGAGIAAAVLISGFDVVLCDASSKALDAGSAKVEAIVKKAELRGRVKKGAAGKLTSVSDISKLSACNFVIEAVFEDSELKKSIFKKLDAVCQRECILCSNTSSLDVDVFAEETRRADKVLGLHFFSPAHIMKLVEVVQCEMTSESTVSLVMQLVKHIRKVGVLVTNLPGFVGNRMIFVYAMEAMLLLEEGASVSQVDGAMKDFGMAMGPFEMADLSGLDVGYKIRLSKGLVDTQTPSEATGIGPSTAAVVTTSGSNYSAIGDVLYKAGRLGAKNGLGFYKYLPTSPGKGGRPTPQTDPLVTETIAVESQRKSVVKAAAQKSPTSGVYQLSPAVARVSIRQTDIRQRLLFSLVNEGFRLLGEHGCVSDRPGDIDIVYTHGYGFPAYRGGPLFWADFAVGLRGLHDALQLLYVRYPKSPWFEPAPLLSRMLENNVTLHQVQMNPSLVTKLMETPARPRNDGKVNQSKL